MAKAKHPKLKWEELDGGWLAKQADEAPVFRVFQSLIFPELIAVVSAEGITIGYGNKLAAAKAIAQAFADSETLRGEPA